MAHPAAIGDQASRFAASFEARPEIGLCTAVARPSGLLWLQLVPHIVVRLQPNWEVLPLQLNNYIPGKTPLY
jgi:hypothetical protein